MPAHLGSKPTDDQQPLELLQRLRILFAVCSDMRQIVQIEAALHILERSLHGTDRLALGIVLRRDGQRLCRLRPRLRKGILLRSILLALREHVRGQRFGAHAELQRLLGGDDADRAAPLEPAVEAQLGGENGGKRHEDERDDERHAALPFHVLRAPATGVAATPPDNLGKNHPATSIRRRTRPQSLNSMVISTATGRDHRLSGATKLAGGH